MKVSGHGMPFFGMEHPAPSLGADHAVRPGDSANPTLTFAALTMGCRVNQVETERLRQSGLSHGFHPVDPQAKPHLIIINTCSVTAESDRQTRQWIRRIVRENPQAQLVITGCYAQGHAESLGTMPGVALVLGNAEKEHLWTYIKRMPPPSPTPQATQGTRESTPQNKATVCVGSVANRRTTGELSLIEHFSERSRAFLQVQDGCNDRCTFCTIPALRGPSRSLPTEHIIAQAQKYLASGYQELVLTGVNLGAYGRDLAHEITECDTQQDQKITLAHIVTTITQYMGQERLRLSSLDPTDLEEDLMEQFAINPRVCPYLHVSIQSGDNTILKRMGRGYDRTLVLDKIKRLRRYRPDMVFGADLIVGFPTETPEAFQSTLDLIQEAALTFLHIFRYSDRPGTPAAAIPGRFRVSGEEARKRSDTLRQLGTTLLAQTAQPWIGKKVDVLVENRKENLAKGKTAHFLDVRFPATANTLTGQQVAVYLTGFDPIQHCLYGTPCPPESGSSDRDREQ